MRFDDRRTFEHGPKGCGDRDLSRLAADVMDPRVEGPVAPAASIKAHGGGDRRGLDDPLEVKDRQRAAGGHQVGAVE